MTFDFSPADNKNIEKIQENNNYFTLKKSTIPKLNIYHHLCYSFILHICSR